jgi:hypothetical protein
MSTEQEVTPWFDGSVNPVRKGAYQRQSRMGLYSYWNGHKWEAGCNSAARANDRADPSDRWASDDQDAPWRGRLRKRK